MNSSSTMIATVALSAQSSLCNGKYRIIRKLGSGGFGITYLAYDNVLGREVAIKECFPRDLVIRNDAGTNEILPLEGHEAEFEKYKEAFRREAQILAKLPKTNGLVSVFLLEEDNNTWYIIMEYLPGQPLDRYLAENGPVDSVWLLKMIKPVLEALDLVHENGLVHRDISPDNLMLSPKKDHLTLMDFGSAVLLNGRPTHAIGKPGFAPIEQYDETNELTAASDIYALSATIYNLLSGHQPTQATNRVLSKFAGGADPIVRLRSMNDSISQDVEDLVFRGMQLDAKDRYQTAHEMAEAINSILQIDNAPPLPEPESINYKIKYYYDNICDEGLTRIKSALRDSLITDYEMEPKSGYEFERCEPQPFYNGKNPNDNVLRIYYVKSPETELLKCQYRIEYYFDDVCDKQLTKAGTADINSYFSINPQNEKNGFVLDKVLPAVLKVGLNPEDNVIRVYYRSVKPKRYQYRIEHYYDNKIEDSLTTVAMAELSEKIKPSEFFERDGYTVERVEPAMLIISDDPKKNVIRIYYLKTKKKNTFASVLCTIFAVLIAGYFAVYYYPFGNFEKIPHQQCAVSNYKDESICISLALEKTWGWIDKIELVRGDPYGERKSIATFPSGTFTYYDDDDLTPGVTYQYWYIVTLKNGSTYPFTIAEANSIATSFQWLPKPTACSLEQTPLGIKIRINEQQYSENVVESYTLYRMENNGSFTTEPIPIKKMSPSNPFFMDDNLVPNTTYTYYYVIESKNGVALQESLPQTITWTQVSHISNLRVWQDYSDIRTIHVDWDDVVNGEYDVGIRVNATGNENVNWHWSGLPYNTSDMTYICAIPDTEYLIEVTAPITGQTLTTTITLPKASEYSAFGAQAKGGRFVWVSRKELWETNAWNAKNVSFENVNTKEFMDMWEDYKLFFISKFRYSKSSTDHSVDGMIVIRSPEGKVVYEDEYQYGTIDGAGAGQQWNWYVDLEYVIETGWNSNQPELESGEYIVEHYFNDELVNRGTFLITD